MDKHICKCGCHRDMDYTRMNCFDIPPRCDDRVYAGDSRCCGNYNKKYLSINGELDPDRWAKFSVDTWNHYRRENSIEYFRKKK